MASPRGFPIPSASAALIMLLCPRLASSRIGMKSLTGKTFKEFLESSGQVLVDFSSPEDPDWPRRKLELDEVVRHVRFKGCELPVARVDLVVETDLAERYVSNRKHPRLVFFRNGVATKYSTTSRSPERMAGFAMSMHRGPVTIVSEEQDCGKNEVFNRGVIAQVPLSSSLFKAVEEVAQDYRTTVSFCGQEHAGGRIRFTKDGSSSAGAEYEGGASVPQLRAWLRAQLVGARRSQLLPEEPWHEGSLQVVGLTFDKLVLRSSKDCVILIYAPWCGYSRQIFPVWRSFAKEVVHDPRLVVAKMDGDQNEGVEGFTWEGFPTIFLFRAGETEAIEFSGDSTVEGLVDFVKQYRTAPDQFPEGTDTDESELEL